uniref:Tumor necrosis factor receptor superfamily member 14-like n=1 Tax=Paramormyrops kingsleyae TaxID=1676925 RepID=A0A3B3SYD2_9TELE
MTFTDEPNGLTKCKPCTVCDQGLGLKTVRACTHYSDTVCGVLEGHYCINPYKGGCRAANKHTACRPGQFIKQPGLYEFECCPMCPSGHHVQKHCSRNANTTCAPCTGLTFNDEPNGLSHCKLCAVCDQGLGLKTVRACTLTSDTVCGVLEGHYCISTYKGGCRTAHKHTACEPGQFIKQPGTASANTACEDCQENSYSNGSFTSCMPHATCRPGQFIHWMDTECEDCQENTYSNGSFTSCMPCKPGQFIHWMGRTGFVLF